MKIKVLTAFILLAAIFGCSSSSDSDYDKLYQSLEELNAKGALALANEWKFSASDIKSYINSDELVINFPDGREINKKLPDDEMCIAIAPYLSTTHTCSTHYPSSCQGEMVNKKIEVKATDKEGRILFDGFATTLRNGFIELWLPRNKYINIKIAYEGRTAEQVIGTFKGDNTCVTTMKLN